MSAIIVCIVTQYHHDRSQGGPDSFVPTSTSMSFVFTREEDQDIGSSSPKIIAGYLASVIAEEADGVFDRTSNSNTFVSLGAEPLIFRKAVEYGLIKRLGSNKRRLKSNDGGIRYEVLNPVYDHVEEMCAVCAL